MTRVLVLSLVFGLFLVACDSDDPGVDCAGEGTFVREGLQSFCAYVVVVGGFECPRELPNRFDIEGHVVCSDRNIGGRDDLPAAVCAELGIRCPVPPPIDGGVVGVDSGAMADAGNGNPDAATDAGDDARVIGPDAGDGGPADGGDAGPGCTSASCGSTVCGRSDCGFPCGSCDTGESCWQGSNQCTVNSSVPGTPCVDAFGENAVEGDMAWRACDANTIQRCTCSGGGPDAFFGCGPCVDIRLAEDPLRGVRCLNDDDCGSLPCNQGFCGESCSAASPQCPVAGTVCFIPGDMAGACIESCSTCGAECDSSRRCRLGGAGELACVLKGFSAAGDPNGCP